MKEYIYLIFKYLKRNAHRLTLYDHSLIFQINPHPNPANQNSRETVTKSFTKHTTVQQNKINKVLKYKKPTSS